MNKLLTNIITLIVCSAIVAVLAAFGIFNFSVVPGVSTFYIAIGFYIPFAIWFGGWGILANSIGCTIGAIWAGVPVPLAIIVNSIIVHAIHSGLPAWAAKGQLKMDPSLKTQRDWTIYLLVCVLGSVVAGALMFLPTLVMFGIMPWKVALTSGMVSYIVGDIIVILLISTALLTGLSEIVKKSPFYVKGWWN